MQEKTAASIGRWNFAKARSGRRPISVAKLLAREAEGKLFKKHGELMPFECLEKDAYTRAEGTLAGLLLTGAGTALKRRSQVDGEPEKGRLGKYLGMGLQGAGLYATVRHGVPFLREIMTKNAYELMGETEFQGLDIAIENDVGSTRKGKDADGTPWSITYKTPYGYIRGTKGADDEEVDCYVGPKKDADTAYVVHQKKDDGSYDEDTVMLGYHSKEEAKKDILRHYSDPKYIGDVIPISMKKLHDLLAKDEKLVKISRITPPTHDHDYADNEFDTTGIPARLPKRRLELPTRDEVDINPRPRAEQRQDSQGTLYVGDLGTPGAFDDLGKTAMSRKISRAMETLGELSRNWEVPSKDEERGSAYQEERHGPFGITLSEIGPQEGDPWEGSGQATEQASHISKAASISFEAFIEELGTLNVVTEHQLAKVAAEVSKDQAQKALERLDELEHQKPTMGQLGRGALVGSVVGPISSNVNKLIAIGKLTTPREILGQTAGGAIFGMAAPYLKHKVETGTERKVLKDYVQQSPSGRLAAKIENKLETP